MQLHCVHCRLDFSIKYFSFANGKLNSDSEIPIITLTNTNCWTLFRVRTHCLIHACFKATL